MKAMVFTVYGSPESLRLEEVAKPIPNDDEVLVNVYAASINDWDWQLLQGKPFVNRLMFGLPKPKILALGCDIAGRVVAIGRNVTNVQVGDEVFGDISGGRWGGFADYVCAHQNAVVHKPATMTFAQAAATPQAAVLALQGLRDNGQIQPGQTVLINGAGGGVGTFAIQMAKLFGAEVTGVDRTEKLALMRSLGTDHVIDYTQEDFTQNGRRYDRILDVVGSRSFFEFQRVLAPNGIYFMVGGPMPRILQTALLGWWVSRRGQRQMGLLMHQPNKDLALISELFDAGTVVPVIDRSYSLEQLPTALQYFGEGHHQGKVVITIKGENAV